MDVHVACAHVHVMRIYRLVEDAPITINNAELEAKVGNIKFFSATYRLFKLPGLLEPVSRHVGPLTTSRLAGQPA